jgi:hypothetical protein
LSLLGEHGVPFGLDSPDLIEQQFHPVELAQNLALHVLGQVPPITRPQRFQPLAAISP